MKFPDIKDRPQLRKDIITTTLNPTKLYSLSPQFSMLSTSFLTLAATFVFSALFANAAVEPVFVKQHVNWTEHQFSAPGPGDVRGPCPALNTYVSVFLFPSARLITSIALLQAC